MCLIKGKTVGHLGAVHQTYYVPHTDYDFASPPLRSDLREVIDLVAIANSPAESTRIGINRKSILLELRSLHFTRSFPIDVMHCVLLNVAETLFKLWNGTKLGCEQETSAATTTDHHRLSKEAITAISDSLTIVVFLVIYLVLVIQCYKCGGGFQTPLTGFFQTSNHTKPH